MKLLRDKPEIYLVPLAFVVVTAIWEYLVITFEVSKSILPAPSEIGSALVAQVQTSFFWNNVKITTQEALIGFAAATIFAIIAGTFISQVKVVEKVAMPYLVGFQAIPKVALGPLFVIWFGFGMTSKVVMAATIAFFPILINIIEGLRSADAEQIRMLRVFGATRFQIFRKVQVPNSMPFFFAGLDVGLLLAILGAVVGEFLGAQVGLGNMIQLLQYSFDVAGMFSVLLVLSMMGILAHILIRALQRKFAFWGETDHLAGS